MTTLDERERAFEEKFAHDQEIRFRVHARRNRLLGLWAAKKFHLTPAEADAYANALAQADAHFHDEVIVRQVLSDFIARGVHVTEDEIRNQLKVLLKVASAQVAGNI